jgi:iron(III) transport system ATP-binding protein
MTVADHVAYGLDVRKVAGEERQRRVMDALRSVHMDEYAERKPNQLSGGQQQRVALARALVIEPTVLLLDEPLSNLDAKLRLEMRSEIRRICKQSGITGVYVTHDQKEALSMADRMAVLRAGKIVQAGAPRDLYQRPRTRFVADFLGETNFVEARVRSVEGESVTLESKAGLLQCGREGRDATAGQSVTCSIRPESWQLAHGKAPGSPASPSDINSLQGRVVRTTYLGEVAQHVIALAGDVAIRVLEMNPSGLADNMQGREITVRANADDVVILDD